MTMGESYEVTARTKVRTHPERANYDRETVHAILDEAFVCHVGFVVDGKPMVIPTMYARKGETLYIHGSVASRMLNTLQKGVDVCVTVTLIDGLVLARSAKSSSINYRSVVILGKAELVSDREAKQEASRCLTEQVLKGRWSGVRHPSDAELDGVTVLAIPINEVSAKIRTGGPKDYPKDVELPHWAGVLPIVTEFGAPVDSEDLRAGVEVPEHVRDASWKGRSASKAE